MKNNFIPMIITVFFMAIFIFLITISLYASSNNCYVIFDNWIINNNYTINMANSDFAYNCKHWNTNNSNTCKISSKHSLEVKFPKNNSGYLNSGLYFLVRFDKSPNYSLEYDLTFNENFEWKNGGMLPGISSNIPGFSGNKLERSITFSPTWGSDGLCGVYINKNLYSPEEKLNYYSNKKFEQNKLYRVKILCSTNINSKIVTLNINNEDILTKSIPITNTKIKLDFDTLVMSTFYFDTPNNSPQKDCTLFLDNIKMFAN